MKNDNSQQGIGRNSSETNTIHGKVDIVLRNGFEVSKKCPVTAEIERALQSHFAVDTSDIKILVKGGMVILQGSVDTWCQKELAARTARKIPRVLAVDNQLKVTYQSRIHNNYNISIMKLTDNDKIQMNEQEAAMEYGAKDKGIRHLFINEIQDVFQSEQFTIAVMPQLINKVTDIELRNAMDLYFEKARNQLARLEKIFYLMGQKEDPTDLHPTSLLFKRSQQIISETEKGLVMDLGILSAILKLDTFQMASYASLRSFSITLDKPEIILLLQLSLQEKTESNMILKQIIIGLEEQIQVHYDANTLY